MIRYGAVRSQKKTFERHACHLTSAHFAGDGRITKRQVEALLKGDCAVTLVARGSRSDVPRNCHFLPLSNRGDSLGWRLVRQSQGWFLAIRSRAPVIIIHDPDLLPVGILIQMLPLQRQIIFDSHEDYVDKFYSRWVAGCPGWLLSLCFRMMLKIFPWIGGKFFAPTESLCEQLGLTESTFVPNEPSAAMNTSLVESLARLEVCSALDDREVFRVVYVGSIAAARSLEVWIEPLTRLEGSRPEIVLAGPVAKNATAWLSAELQNSTVSYIGELDYLEIPVFLSTADCGVIILPNTKSYRDSLPTKLYEYLGSGLPVVMSNFESFRKVVDEVDGAGFYCDPSDRASVQDAFKAARHFSRMDSLSDRIRRSQRSITRFGWEYHERRYVDVVSSLCQPSKVG